MMQAISHMRATRRDMMTAMAAVPIALSAPAALRAATMPSHGPQGVKILSIVARKPDMTQDRFRQHWLGIHGPMARTMPGLQGFILSEPVHDSSLAAPDANYAHGFDGMATLWYPSQQALRSGLTKADARAWLAEGAQFIDRPASRNYVVSEQIVVAPPRAEGGIKRTALLVRKPGTTHAQFMEHWTKTHADMARTVPGLQGCVFNKIEASLDTPGSPWAEIDGIAELWWDNGAVNFGDWVASPQSTAWADHSEEFIDHTKSRAIISLEHVMV